MGRFVLGPLATLSCSLRSRAPWALVACAALSPACELFAPEAPRYRTMLSIRAPEAGGTKVREILQPTEVPLRGNRLDAKKGDFLVQHDGMAAVVSRLDGEIVDFGPDGGLDGIVAITPALFDPLGQAKAAVVFIGEDEDTPGVLHIVRRGALPVRLHTFVTFRGKLLVVESTVEPESIADSGMSVVLGERIGWGNFPTWVEGVGFVRKDAITEPTRFVGREGKELSYALSIEGTKSLVRYPSGYLSGYFAAGRGSEFVVANAGDRSPRRTILMAASTRSIGDAVNQLPPIGPTKSYESPKGLPKDGYVETAECPDKEKDEDRKPYLRYRGGETLVVPAEGCFEVRAWAPGRGTTPWQPIEEASKLELAPSGTLVVSVAEGGKPAIARIQVRGVGNTSNPDWGEDPEDGTAVNVAHIRKGVFVHEVPPGKYRVIVDRGFEYSAADQTVDVTAGEKAFVNLSIERVVDTKGWISADLHLHADPSFDAPQPLTDRVLGLAASGVEVGVATDHNRVTDYSPVVNKLGLKQQFASVVGDEITTEEMAFGHFNVFPIDPSSAPLAFRRTSPAKVFEASRASKPYGRDTIIQVNHPRMGDIGYFEIMRLDKDDIASFVQRTPWASLDFDAMEIFNGDDAVSPSTVEGIMKDWFALMDFGKRATATGNSDSHRLTFQEPGLPRTYVAMPNDDPASFDERAFVAALRQGKVTVSSGPFIRFSVGGVEVGGTVPAGQKEARVTVDCPEWMKVTYVEIVQKGKVVARADAPFGTPGHAAELVANLTLASGDWVIARTGGTREMDVLFRRGVPPYAFTNAIYVGP